MLLICPLRPGDNNEELRYALRSWDTNLILDGGLELWTVGHCPDWLDPDRHIEGNEFMGAQHNVWSNVLKGSEAAASAGYDQVVYMNDDFFCMDPTGAVLPVRRNLTLAQHLGMFRPDSHMWWVASLALTASWLAEAGFPHPWSYEVHRPLLASPGGMFQALSTWDGGMEGALPQWRTIYGTLCGVEAYPVPDVKLSPEISGVGSPWISTSDTTWRRYANSIAAGFPETSRWEQ